MDALNTGLVNVTRLCLSNFRNFSSAKLAPAQGGVTVIVGPNASGKTSLLEAISYCSGLSSFRGATREALVRAGEEVALVACNVLQGERKVDISVTIKPGHRDLALLNGRPPVATRDLVAVLQTTLFSPDDLELVKGGPAGRRELLDDANAASLPQAAQERSSFDRILRQRNTLLHQLSGRLSEDERLTLDIWDDRLAEAGERLAERREKLVAALLPFVTDAWSSLVPDADPLSMAYQRSFAGNLRQALVSRRDEDLRRQVTTVGPQRDDLLVFSGDLDARTRLSQGRQRCVALSLRLAVHRYLTDVTGFAPVLLLDDAFSELDQRTSYLLVRELPRSQAIVTTAGEPPSGFPNALIVNLEDGVLR